MNLEIWKMYYWITSNWSIQKWKLKEIQTIQNEKGTSKLLTFKTGISEKQYAKEASICPDFYESVEKLILNNNF